MQMETFVLEEKNFGEAQQAYNTYPQVEQRYNEKLNEYRSSFNDLNIKNLADIKVEDMRRVDVLADETESAQQTCFELKNILLGKIDELVLDAKQKDDDIGKISKEMSDELGLDHGRLIMDEAQNLKEKGDIIKALDQAYMARESFTSLLAEIRERWASTHQKRIYGLMVGMEIIE